MPIVSIETLKGYFNDGDVPTELEYIDLIDTLNQGDMTKSVYDTNDDGKVNSADNADALGGVAASSYLQRTSAARPGVTKLFRSDSDSGYYVRHYWTGTHWYLQGYNSSDVFHAGCRVEYANVAPWTGISGKPATYPPSTHTHYSVEYADVAGNADNADLLDSINSTQFARSDVADTIGGLWSINNDLRIRDGLYVGSTGTNPTNGNVQATADICAGGGLYAGNAAAAATNGYVEASTHLVANSTVFGRGIDAGRFRSGVYIGYANDVDTDCITFKRHQYDAHIYNATNGSYGASMWINYYGQTTYNTVTRVANGRGSYGNIHADNFTNESRSSSKRDVRSYKDEVSDSLALIEKIRPVKYKKSHPNASNPDQDRIGMIAEELLEVLPEVVAIDQITGEAEGIDYGQIVPLLILSIQELRSQVKELQHGRNIGD